MSDTTAPDDYTTEPPPPAPPPPAAPVGAPTAGINLPDGVQISSVGRRIGAWALDGLLAFVTLGIGWGIWAAVIAGNGVTPAKKLLGMRVVSLNNTQPASFATMFFMRGLIGGFVASLAATFTLGVLLFMPLWDKRNQNLWDKVSSTIVVDDASNAWGR